MSLRQLFLVAPLLGLIMLGVLLTTFTHESRRHNALLANVTEQRLTAFDRYADVFIGLSEHHLALYGLLTKPGRVDAEVVYLRGRPHLIAIHEATASINDIFNVVADSRANDTDFKALRDDLRRLINEYHQAVTSAVKAAATNSQFASRHFALANERFGAMSHGFSQLLELQRQNLAANIAAESRRSRNNMLVYTIAALAGAAALLFLSLALSRFLSATLETQIDTLAQLDEQADPAPGSSNEIQRIGHAIESFRRTQTQLRESELRFRRLFEHNHAVMLLIQPTSGAILAANEAAAEFYGYARDQLSTLTIDAIDTLPPERAALERQSALLENRRHFIVTHRLADGQERIVEVHSTPINSGGEILLFSIIHDITERMRVEAELRSSKEALNDAQAVAKVGSWTLDLRTSSLTWSRETYRIFGVPPDTPMTMESFLACIHPADLKFVSASWNAALAGQAYDIEHRTEVDGEIRWVRECAHIRFDADGVASFGIGTVQDVSELKHAQQALHDLNRDLERRVSERTAQLQEASRAKSDFLTNMSHEIRTPMNTVLGMAHLALCTSLTRKQREYLEKIQGAGDHLLCLIDSILDISKIEAGKLELEAVDFDFAEVMKNIGNLCAEQATAKGLRFVFDLDPGIARHLRGDPLRLSQVLINYTNNAVKFTERGEIVIRAKVVEDNEDGYCLLRFAVEDTGIGMSAEHMSKLFQVFQQSDGSTTRKYGGTGLGLAISKQLTTLMGGTVGVNSELGKGSVFWFTVQLGKAGADICPRSAKQAAAVRGAIEGARILLADDHPLNLQVARDLLEQVGAEVHVANNGREAIDLLLRERFDCVLMDVQMPEMDGRQATQLIRAEPALAATPVIAMTANAWNEERERCLAAGMNDFISKPVQPELLYAVVAKWLTTPAPMSSVAITSAPGSSDGHFRGDPDVIDLTVLAKTLKYDPAKIRRVLGKFVDATWNDIAKMEAALEHDDIETLGALGHRIKSPAQALGAMGLVGLCQGIEMVRNGGNVEQAAAAVRQLRPLLTRISQSIERNPNLASST